MGMFGSLFGAPKKKKNPWEYDPTTAAQEAAWGFPAKEDPEMAKPKSDRWIDGGNFTGKDALAIALTSVGDAFSRQAGGEGNAMSSYMGQAAKARDAARKAQLAAAERQGKIELAQRVNGWTADQAEGNIEGVWKPTEKQWRYVDDNVGNQWKVDPVTGERKRIFTDETPKYYIQGDQAIQIQNPYVQSGQETPPPPPKTAIPAYTAEQYKGLLSTLGPAGAAAHLAKTGKRAVTRTGTVNGRRVIQYSDGTIEYAD